jgi:hypothetical protein
MVWHVGGIQRRRRRMRQHQPVTPDLAPADPSTTPTSDADADADADADDRDADGAGPVGTADAVGTADVEAVTIKPTSGPPITAKPHPPVPRPPFHPPTSGPPAPTGGAPAPTSATVEPSAGTAVRAGEPDASTSVTVDPIPATVVPTSGAPVVGSGGSELGGEPPRPSPHHLAELSGAFAMTANVHDPEPVEHEAHPSRPVREDHNHDHDHHHDAPHHHHDEVVSERGLRGLVGGGASQVSVSAAMRARDAARPTDEDLAAADRDLQIVRRGWVPREELTRPGRRSPTS